MVESVLGSDAELRISPKSVIASLTVTGVVLVVVAQFQSDLAVWSHLLDLSLVVMAASAVAWVLDGWVPWAGRWFVVLTSAVVLYLASSWLAAPAALGLMVMPMVLAVALLGAVGGVVTAVGESIFLLGIWGHLPPGAERAHIAVELGAIWVLLGLIHCGLCRPVQERNTRLDEYFRNAQLLVKETRDRKAAYQQALADLGHANRQLALLNQRATDLRLIAEEAQRAKGKFVARVSHEFRTPLNMIIGLVELMVERPQIYDVVLSPKLRDDLGVVHRNCKLLTKMVNDVLDLSQAETDRLPLHKERVKLQSVIDSAVVAVRPLLEGKRLALNVAAPSDLPAIYCDGTRIEQVVLNLLSNAARYTETGGVTVQVTLRDEHVRVSVTDTGPGIAPQDVDRIFEPFFQSAESLWHGKHGSGLGLSISKRIVELHGGRIWFQTEVGVGTTFTFELPISPPLEPIRRPGGQLSAEWLWRKRDSWATFSDSHYRPRFILYDPQGELHTAFTHQTGEIEFTQATDFVQVGEELGQCPAHALILNAPTRGELWSLLDNARHYAAGTPIVACSVAPTHAHARALGSAGYLVKPVTRAQLEGAMHALGKPMRRVLVVDDDPDALGLFERMLHACDGDLEVVTAPNGKQALDVLQRSLPDLMLLDLVMPDMDGWEVLGAMARNEHVRDVPTLIVSATDATDQPPTTDFLLVTMDKGLSLGKLLRSTLELSDLLLKPEGELDPTPV